MMKGLGPLQEKENKLKGPSNWTFWKETILAVFQVAYFGCLLAILGKPAENNVEPNDATAISLIKLSVTPNILTQISMLKHKKASDLWNWLQATYGTTSHATKQCLFNKIFCGPAVPSFDKFDVRTFIEEKVDAQNQFNENCRTTTEKIGDNLICFAILAGLPLEYNNFKTTIAITLESLTVNGLMEKLLNEETQIRMTRAANGNAEPTKSNPEKPVDLNLKAYLGQSLEKAVEFMNNQTRSKHQHKHNKDKQKNRIPVLGGGVHKHGHDRHNSGGGGRGGDKGVKTCHLCGKPGHLKVNCWHNPASKNFRGSSNPKTTTAHVAVRDF
jgi:hypothetical protein